MDLQALGLTPVQAAHEINAVTRMRQAGGAAQPQIPPVVPVQAQPAVLAAPAAALVVAPQLVPRANIGRPAAAAVLLAPAAAAAIAVPVAAPVVAAAAPLAFTTYQDPVTGQIFYVGVDHAVAPVALATAATSKAPVFAPGLGHVAPAPLDYPRRVREQVVRPNTALDAPI